MSQKNGLSISTFIPESIGSKDILFENAPIIGTVEFFDGVIIFSPAFVFLMIGEYILPSFLEPYIIIFTILIAMVGSTLLIMKPKYMTLYQWFDILKNYQSREKEMEKNFTDENGQPFNSISIVPDDDTRKLTKVDKIYPERNVIELDDGTIVTILEFKGSNLDMASPEQVVSTVNQYSNRLSSQLQKKIQFYMPMRPISLESTAKLYEDEQEGRNMRTMDDKFMDMYREDRISWVRTLSQSSYVREQYVIIPVEEKEIINDGVSTNSSGLNAVPGGELFQDIIRGLMGKSVVESKQEIKRRQLREISKRRDSIGSTLNVGPGNEYNVVSHKKCIALIKEFWEGDKIQSDEMDALTNEHDVMISSNKSNNNGDEQ